MNQQSLPSKHFLSYYLSGGSLREIMSSFSTGSWLRLQHLLFSSIAALSKCFTSKLLMFIKKISIIYMQ